MSTLNQASPEELIRLIPSNSDTQLQIHERLLSVSPSLYSVCEKSWKEHSRQEYKFMEFNENEDQDTDYFVEVTEEMLICFVSWAYVGNYTTEAAGISSYIAEYAPFTRKKKDKKKTDRFSMWSDEIADGNLESQSEEQSLGTAFNSLDIPIEAWPSGAVTPQETQLEALSVPNRPTAIHSGSDNKKTLHPLFLNVQIYTFANIYLIESLKMVSRGKIIDYLGKLEKSPMNFMESIFDTLEYALSNLPDDDVLLDWLARYCSWKLGDLRRSLRFHDILGAGNGKLAILLIRHIGPSQTNPFGESGDNAWPFE